jgi:chloramphenicol O-acetyltransferase type B
MKAIFIFFSGLFRRLKTWICTSVVKYTCGGYKDRIRVNGWSLIGRNVFLGSNVNFNGIKIFAGAKSKILIGDNFHSGKECMIMALYHNFEGEAIPYDTTNIDKHVTIEDNVWIGHRVIILGGVTIGEGAIIQAGAVVVNDIEPCGIAGGNPAKVFKYRNKDHYYKLKQEGRFH